MDSIREEDDNPVLVNLLKLALEDTLNYSMVQFPPAVSDDIIRGWDTKLLLV